MADLQLIRTLSEAHGVSGREFSVGKLVLEQLGEQASYKSDAHGSLVFYPKQKQLAGANSAPVEPSAGQSRIAKSQGLPQVMVCSHLDEIGFMVQNLGSDGGISAIALGGWWTHALLAQRFVLSTRSGKQLTAVVSATPPHLLGRKRTELLKLEQILFDVGASSADELAALGIRAGDILVPKTSFESLAVDGRYVGKALDNRLGVALMIETARTLFSKPADNQSLFLASVQEEVGTRGAQTAARMTQADVAIVLECAPADDLLGPDRARAQANLGEGVQIRAYDPSAIANSKLVDLAIDLAEQQDITYQLAVRRGGGTDAKVLHLANQGIATIVLSVPARNIHSHSGIFDVADYDATLTLTQALVRALDAQQVERICSHY